MTLTVTINSAELWDEHNQRFVTTAPLTVELEHSLASIARWESRWKQAFLGKRKKTPEMAIDYVRCMTIDPTDLPYEAFVGLMSEENEEVMMKIRTFMEDKQSASFFQNASPQKPSGPTDVPTSEVMYSWIVEFGLDWEVQHWHLGRFLTLVKVCELSEERKARAEKAAYSKIKKPSVPSRGRHRR